jgi:hypothetical protein
LARVSFDLNQFGSYTCSSTLVMKVWAIDFGDTVVLTEQQLCDCYIDLFELNDGDALDNENLQCRLWEEDERNLIETYQACKICNQFVVFSSSQF